MSEDEDRYAQCITLLYTGGCTKIALEMSVTSDVAENIMYQVPINGILYHASKMLMVLVFTSGHTNERQRFELAVNDAVHERDESLQYTIYLTSSQDFIQIKFCKPNQTC